MRVAGVLPGIHNFPLEIRESEEEAQEEGYGLLFRRLSYLYGHSSVEQSLRQHLLPLVPSRYNSVLH